MIELKEFLEIIKLLEDNYNRKLPDSIVKIWYDEFKTFKPEYLRYMFAESIKEFTYFPTINQIINYMKDSKIPFGHMLGDVIERGGHTFLVTKEGAVLYDK